MVGSPPPPQARIGAHLSVSKGLVKGALGRAELVGAEAAQIFLANPRGWAEPTADPVGDDAFRRACRERDLLVFVHAPYLINFGSPSPQTLAKSSASLAFSLRRAQAVGAAGVVLHAGSAVLGARRERALIQVREHLLPLLDHSEVRLLIEPTAGGGGALASDIDSIAAYLDHLDDERVGLCIDTCHLHAAGHDLSAPAGLRAAFTALGRAVGRERIGLVHVNDSHDPAGSKRDRHAALGAGSIGLPSFGALFSTAVTRDLPMIVETDEKGQAGDVDALKALRAAARAG